MLPIAVVGLLILLIVTFMTMSRKADELRARIASADEQKEQKRLEAEKARADLRERKDELEKLREELQEAKAKLKRKEKDSVPSGGEKPAKAPKTSTPPAGAGDGPAISAVVRISNQELEAEHQAKVSALEAEVAAAKARVAELEAKDQARAAELERARKRLETPSEAPKAAPAPVEGKRPEEKVQALETQLEAMERAANEREKQLKKELDKLGVELRSAERRARENHQLYQVAKGQMVVIEERLATLRKKHEGAIAPESLRKAAPADVHQAETTRPGDPSTPAVEPPPVEVKPETPPA